MQGNLLSVRNPLARMTRGKWKLFVFPYMAYTASSTKLH